MEPCLSCGRMDQPERFHTHPSHPSKEKEKDVKSSNQKSPLKENRQNTKELEKSKTEQSHEHLKDKQLPNMRRQRRSQSPKKSLSPEKSVSPIETSETQSPQVKRRQKTSKNNEKENEGSQNTENSKRTQKSRGSRPKQEGVVRPKQNCTEFTVDIFTAKTSEEREREKSDKSRQSEGKIGVESEESGEDVELTSLSSPVSSLSSRPTVKCNTCGKEFGKSSIKFHEPQCKKKKIAENLKKEKEKSDSEDKQVSHIAHVAGN